MMEGIVLATREDWESKIGTRSHVKCILTSFLFFAGDLLCSYYTKVSYSYAKGVYGTIAIWEACSMLGDIKNIPKYHT